MMASTEFEHQHAEDGLWLPPWRAREKGGPINHSDMGKEAHSSRRPRSDVRVAAPISANLFNGPENVWKLD